MPATYTRSDSLVVDNASHVPNESAVSAMLSQRLAQMLTPRNDCTALEAGI